jgi:hypothetical protein
VIDEASGEAGKAGELPAFIQQRIATAIDGSGPPRSRAARRSAATNRSSESMVSMSRIRGAYGRTNSRHTSPSALTTYAVVLCWTAFCHVIGAPVT